MPGFRGVTPGIRPYARCQSVARVRANRARLGPQTGALVKRRQTGTLHRLQGTRGRAYATAVHRSVRRRYGTFPSLQMAPKSGVKTVSSSLGADQ